MTTVKTLGRMGGARSGQDFTNDISVHVGEAEVAALGSVGELGVIEAQRVEDGGVEVVDVDLVLDGVEVPSKSASKNPPIKLLLKHPLRTFKHYFRWTRET
jgi:hypothetical protein